MGFMDHDFDKYPELTNSNLDTLGFISPHKQITEDFRATVKEVIDGDTLKLQWDERDFLFPLRIIDLQAPELSTREGKQAKKWLKSKIEGQEVYVKMDKKFRVGKWGRLIGKPYHSGISVTDMVVYAGHGVRWEDRHQGEVESFDNMMKDQEEQYA